MADLTAPSNWYLDLDVPSILRRRDGQTGPTPLQVPELVPNPSDRRASEATSGASNRVRPPGALKGRLNGFRSAAPATTTATAPPAATAPAAATAPSAAPAPAAIHSDLAQLEHQVAGLRRERDDLLATAIPLRAEVAALRSDRDELFTLQSEIEILRRRKRSLEDAIAGRPRSPEQNRSPDQKKAGLDGYQRFHDS